MNAFGPAAFGGLFLLLWLAMMAVGIGGWVMVILSLWRGMKAHESIAMSMRILAEKTKDHG